MNSSNLSTGYGPNSACRKNFFNSENDDYELWEVKFCAFLRLNKLHTILKQEPTDETRDEFDEKNADIFSALVQFIDDKALSLIIRDANNDGKAALTILRNHYIGSTKPRVISLYCELTTLKMAASETVTDYLIRAETAATRLKQAKEVVSDSLLIAMIIKGLPDKYRAFTTVISQNDSENLEFQKFKNSLRSYEENEKSRDAHCSSNDTVLQINNSFSKIHCYLCGQEGHKKNECRSNNGKYNKSGTASVNRYCVNCRSPTHNTQDCRRKKTTAKFARNTATKPPRYNDDEDSFIFKVSVSTMNDNSHDINMKNNFLIDCGATAHIVCDKDKFVKFDDNFDSKNHIIELADNSRHQGIVVARGDAQIFLNDSHGIKREVILKDTLCIPSYKQDIISVNSLTNKGIKVIFGQDYAKMVAPNGTIFNINQSGKLYYVNNLISKAPKTRTLEQWHNILGHCNVPDIIKLEKVVKGMHISDKTKFDCEICMKGKMCQPRNHDSDAKATKPLELVHSDLSGPISPPSFENSKYSINFVDDYTGLITVYFLKNKSDAAAATERFIADMRPYGEILRFRSDNGSEYASAEFRHVMTKNKIKHEFSAPYSPHMNGTSERAWRSLYNMARCMLVQSGLPKRLWNYALRSAAYIRNRCFNNRLGLTAFEAFTSKKPDLSKIESFGSTCYAYVQNKKKLDDRAREGKFVGFDPLSPAYLVYFAATSEIRRVRCVEFFKNNVTTRQDDECCPLIPKINLETKNESANEVDDSSSPAVHPTRSSIRVKKKPAHLEDYILSDESSPEEFQDCTLSTIDYFCKISNIPLNYKEAMASPEKTKWQTAMEEELRALEDNDTFQIVPKENRQVVGGRWVYSTKTDNNNSERYKARYVAKGYLQVQDMNYSETFSPTAKMTSVRILMDLAVKENLMIHQMDVKNAYLHSDIDYDIHVQQPEGFRKYDKNGVELVLKLNKSLYGLKQSGKMWNDLLNDFLCSIDFQQSQSDHCVYTKNVNDIKTVIIVWVDDLIIASSDLSCINEVKRSLCDRFKMKDFGVISNFLGIEFEVNNNSIKMHQTKFINKLLTKFRMEHCNPKLVPCDINAAKIDHIEDSQILDDIRGYREIVGSLIYLMTCTRPDICYVVTKLSQNLANPTVAHLNLAKYVLKYLKGTINQGIVYHANNEPVKLIGYSDSDWGTSSDRRSISGYVFKLSENSSIISWRSKKQPTVALSTCEAEYMALTCAIQEGIFLKQLLNDMLTEEVTPIFVHVDNKGTMELANNPVHHKRSKHIDIRFHFIREHIQNGHVAIYYVPTSENIADIFTKPMSRISLQKFNLVQ